MTKKEADDVKQYLKQTVIKGLVLGVIGAVVTGLVAAFVFMMLAPTRLEALDSRICGVEENVKVMDARLITLRSDMNSNQEAILNILRREYNVSK